jgi:release factor glutamine methyltransferase
LVAHPERVAAPGHASCFRAWVERRARREPLAHILGYREFRGRRFTVSPAVLTPRPETERLVDIAIDHLRRLSLPNPRVLDVGTGSGAIAISILAELPASTAVATDVSLAALEVAHDNARTYEVDRRLRVVACDLASAVRQRFPVVVANLPYVATARIGALEPEVREHDPRVALDGGVDGTALIRQLLTDLDRLLAPDGLAALEIGESQGPDLGDAARTVPGSRVRIERDLAGCDRYLIVERAAA